MLTKGSAWNRIFYFGAIFLLPFTAVSPWQTPWPPFYSGFLFGVPIVLALLLSKRDEVWRVVRQNGFLLLFIVINIFSVWLNWGRWPLEEGLEGAVGPKTPGVYSIFLIGYYLFAFILVLLPSIIRNTSTAFKFYVVSGILAALYGLVQFVLYSQGVISNLPGQEWILPRLVGTATEAQVFGNFINSLLPVLFFVPGLWLAAIPLFVAETLTFALGAWIGLFVGLLFFIRRVWKKLGIAVIASALIVIVIQLLWIPNLSDGIPANFIKIKQFVTGNTLTQEPPEPFGKWENVPVSGSDRKLLVKTAWTIFRQSPLIGVGLGNYGYLYNRFKPANTESRPYPAKPHNAYLEIMAESGIIGFGVILLYLGGIFKGVYAKRRNLLVLGLLCASIAILVNGMSFGIFFHVSNWLVLGWLRSECG